MEFTVRPFKQADAEQIAQWNYEGPYAFYDMENDQDDLAELMDPLRGCLTSWKWPGRHRGRCDHGRFRSTLGLQQA